MVPVETPGAWLAPTAVAVPIVAACLLIMGERRLGQRATDLCSLVVATCVVGLDAALLALSTRHRLVDWLGGWRPAHGYSVGVAFVADEVGAGIALLAAVLCAIAILYSGRYFDEPAVHFHPLLLTFLAGMEGFSLSGDLFDLFVFFELMGASAYALTAIKVEDQSALQGGVNFGIVNSLGAYVSLFGVGILFAKTGNLGLPQLSAELAHHRADLVVVVALVLISCGFLVKAAVVPFHFWLADAHAVAPAPVCVLFSGVMVPLGLYGALRVYWEAFSRVLPPVHLHELFFVLGATTAILGSVMSITQRHFKRTLAYSTITHVGIFLVSAGLLSVSGTAAALLYVLAHAGVKSALFLLAGVTLNRYGSVDEVDLHARGAAHRGTGWLLVVGGLALAGLPPFGVSLAKALGEDAVIHAGDAWAVVVIVVASALSGSAVLRFAARVYFGLGERAKPLPGASSGEEVRDTTFERRPVSAVASILLLLAGGFTIGVVPGIHAAALRAAAAFVDAAGYSGAALNGTAVAPAASSAGDWTWLGVLLGFASAALAVGVAGLALFGRGLLGRVPTLHRRTTRSLRVLHAVHSGHVGDYVVWLVVGLAVLLALAGGTVA